MKLGAGSTGRGSGTEWLPQALRRGASPSVAHRAPGAGPGCRGLAVHMAGGSRKGTQPLALLPVSLANLEDLFFGEGMVWAAQVG